MDSGLLEGLIFMRGQAVKEPLDSRRGKTGLAQFDAECRCGAKILPTTPKDVWEGIQPECPMCDFNIRKAEEKRLKALRPKGNMRGRPQTKKQAEVRHADDTHQAS